MVQRFFSVSHTLLNQKFRTGDVYFMNKLVRNLKRGDIFYIVGDPDNPPVGAEIWSDRAGLVVSSDPINKTSNAIEIVYVSTSQTKRLSPTHIPVTSGNKKAIAICEQVHTVDISRLTDYFGTATEEEMKDVDAGIMFGLGINRGTNPQGIFRKWENYMRKYHLPTTIDSYSAN